MLANLPASGESITFAHVMSRDEQYMHRCMELAQKGCGYVAPNPMVGAVLVKDDVIVGEGWHQRYGEAHAEVNCIDQAIRNGFESVLQQSTLYVSLEPCAHFGKTPPCTDLIIRHQIPRVVIGCRDPFKEVDGKGIEKLKDAGVEVTIAILKNECEQLNKRFFTFHKKQRPFIILKWAQTANGKISGNATERLHITNEFTNRMVHQWRSEEASILVGTNTALLDNPHLTNRYFNDNQPIRLLLDKELKIPASAHLYNSDARTIVFNLYKSCDESQPQFVQLNPEETIVKQIVNELHQMKIQSVLVEGGAQLLQSFIDEGMWDEARIITNEELTIENGLPAPILTNGCKLETVNISGDTIQFYKQETINY